MQPSSSTAHQPHRHVVFVSDGTGITAQTLGQALLAQFECRFTETRLPFVDNFDKAQQARKKINQLAVDSGTKPLVFMSLVDDELRAIVMQAQAMCTDLISSYLSPLEAELGMKSNHSIGKHYLNSEYKNRIEAINYSLIHDDGQTVQDFAQADLILIGVSRCGKTPTSLYLAMQHCKKVANYPLVPEDLESTQLPKLLQPFRSKIYGLTIQAKRLAEIRNERRSGSKYAALENCMREINAAEKIMHNEGIPNIDSTARSIEEIATLILSDKRFLNGSLIS